MFPPELVDLILDFAHSDRTTLAACTQVCTAWLPSARYHLFSRILLWAGTPDETVLKMLESSAVSSQMLREIEVRAGCSDILLAKILPQHTSLPLVTTLRIHFGQLLPTSMLLSLPSFPGLQCLEMRNFSEDTFAPLAHWICSVPSLKSLKLSGVLRSIGPFLFATQRLPPQLESLELDCTLPIFFKWLLSFDSVPTVSALALTVPSGHLQTSPLVSQYLVRAGASLKSLNVVYPENIALDLTSNTELESIRIEGAMNPMTSRIIQILNKLPRANNKLKSLAIEAVALHSDFPDLYDTNRWHVVDQALSMPWLQGLQSVELRGRYQAIGAQALRQLFPLCDARGILVTP